MLNTIRKAGSWPFLVFASIWCASWTSLPVTPLSCCAMAAIPLCYPHLLLLMNPSHKMKLMLVPFLNISTSLSMMLKTPTVHKISQAFEVNKSCSSTSSFSYSIGDSVLLSTLHRCHKYLSQNGKHVTKFITYFDGPYTVIDTHPTASTITLELSNTPNACPTFHISLVKPFLLNNDADYPHHAINESQDFFVESIIDHCTCGRGRQFLVKFQGYPDSDNRGLPASDLLNDSALAYYLEQHPEIPS